MNDLQTKESIIIYPNPSEGMIYIDATGQKNGGVTVSDLLGNRVFSSSDIKEKMQINLGDQPSGIYFIEFLSGERRTVKKIVIE